MNVVGRLLDNPLPVRCDLMTWEYRSTFDGEPCFRKVQEQFAMDMPLLVERVGGMANIRIWPMVSFNAAEGRLWRYLVAYSRENLSPQIRCRYLPEQIRLVSLANQFLMNLQKGNSGNCVFWTLHGSLYIFVYFEGRLCHWSEEPGYDEKSLVEKRLERFLKFLRQDSLFSRADYFEVVELQMDESDRSRMQFRDAAKDPFFRKCSLASADIACERKRLLWIKILAVIFPLISLLSFARKDAEIPDVMPIELDLPPVQESVQELRENPIVEHPSETKKATSCEKPLIRLKGIVAGKFAVIESNGLVRTLSVGDSLYSSSDKITEKYFIQNIGRDRIALTCGNEVLEIPVR